MAAVFYRSRRRYRLRHLILPIVGVFVLGYFAYHLVEGDRGIRAWNRVNLEITAAKAAQKRARAKQGAWRRKVNMLRPGTINEDMLDERARRMLNYAREDEIVILYKKPLTTD